MPRVSKALISLMAILAAPAAATALVIEFAGVVDGLIDSAGRLDGSVALGTLVTGAYTVDPTPTGGPAGEVGAARLAFTIGSYAFDVDAIPHGIDLVDDSGPPVAPVDIWQTQAFVAPQLDPAVPLPPDGVGFAATLQLFDFDATMLDGTETAPFVVLDLAGWEATRLTLDALIDDLAGGTAIGDLQISVALQSWSAVPEPASASLLAGGILALAARRRRV